MFPFPGILLARRNRPEWWLLALILVLVGGLLTTFYWAEVERAQAGESIRLARQADLVALNMERDLATTNRALEGVIRDHWIGGAASSSPELISRRLRTLVETVDGVRFMGVFNRNGLLVASSRADLVGKDFSGRNYFGSVRAKPQRGTLYISAPFLSVDSDVVTTVSRMLPGPDGSFAGAVVATLDPEYFADALRPLANAPDVWSVVIHGDGLQLTNFPRWVGGDGSDHNQLGSFFRRHIESSQPASVVSGFVPSFAQQRLMALHTVRPPQLNMDAAMVVGVSRSVDAVLQPVRRDAAIYSGFYAAFVMLSCGLLYWSQWRRRHMGYLSSERERASLAVRGANLGLWDIHLPSGTWIPDKALCAMVGYLPVEMGNNPQKWRELMHPEDREVSTATLAACVDGITPFYDFTYRIQHRDGRWLWMLARGQVVDRDLRGRAVRVMGTIMDISQAKNAEAEVVRARNELQAVFDNMTEGVLVFDKQRTLMRANRAGRTMHTLFDQSMPFEEIWALMDVLAPTGEILSHEQLPTTRGLRNDFVTDYEVQVRRKDNGNSVVLECNSAPILDASGAMEYLIISLHDVTDSRIVTALRQSEVRFRTLIEDAPVAVAILRAGRVVYSNPRYHALHGYAPDEDLNGLAWDVLLVAESRAALRDQLTLIQADSPIEQSFESVGLDVSGTRVAVHNTTALVELADGAATLIFAQNISAQKQAEAALVQARDLAESANRSKAEFLANMSHEIRSPMSVILGLAYLLEKGSLDRDAQDMIHKIRSAGRRLLGIINDVLDVSKIDAGRMELEHAPFRLSDVIENVASTMGMEAGQKNIELVVEQGPGAAGSFMGDALRLEQVLINLTSNAIKFTDVGKVVLKIEAQPRPGSHTLMHFSVKDTGIGIAPALQHEVFSAFSQADSSTTRKFGGTGLGLTICRQLVKLMGGEIGLDSVLGKGSNFWFKIELQAIPQSDFSSPEMARIRTLVVDDSSVSRDAVVAVARGLGWQVAAANSGVAALAELRDGLDGRLPDVVVLDWKMPGMDGLSAARAIREMVPPPQCPIVIMATAYSLSALAKEPDADRVDAILSKPVTLSALYNSVLEARRRRAISVGESPVAADSVFQELLGLRLLVVDDSEINCEVAKRILEQHGAEVHLAYDGAAALDWLIAHPADVDLVLLDVQMPVMDGLEVTRRLRQLPHFKAMPIVALTAGAFKSQQEAAREAGMTDFIGKPFDVPSTIALIQRLTFSRLQNGTQMVAPMNLEAPTPRSGADDVSSVRLAMDVNQGLSLWGKLDTYREYLRRFVADYADVAVLIASSLATGDRAQAHSRAHKLAGVSANMALPEVHRLTNEVARVLLEERDATAALAQLDAALKHASAAIEKFAPAPAPAPAGRGTLRPGAVYGGESSYLADAEVKAQVAALLPQLMRALDTDSPVPAEPVLTKLAQLLPEPQLGQIQSSLRGFDFRAAERDVLALAQELGIVLEK